MVLQIMVATKAEPSQSARRFSTGTSPKQMPLLGHSHASELFQSSSRQQRHLQYSSLCLRPRPRLRLVMLWLWLCFPGSQQQALLADLQSVFSGLHEVGVLHLRTRGGKGALTESRAFLGRLCTLVPAPGVTRDNFVRIWFKTQIPEPTAWLPSLLGLLYTELEVFTFAGI